MSRNDNDLDLTLYNTTKHSDRRNNESSKGNSRSDEFDEYEDKRRCKKNAKPMKKRNKRADEVYSKREVKSIVKSIRKQQIRRRRRKKILKVMAVLIAFLALAMGSLFVVAKYVPGGKEFLLSNCSGPLVRLVLPEGTYDNIHDDEFHKDGTIVNDGIDKDKFTGYYTVALFGIDSRDSKMDSGVNSDAIMIVSINQDTGKVVMSSIYRDTWLNIPTSNGYDKNSFRKINSAFCSGGVKTAINALNTNLDLNISDYVTINFAGLATIVDELGGLDMNITEAELKHLNDYLVEAREIMGVDVSNVRRAGNVHLNGAQVTAYCRIRYCAFFDASGTKYVDDMGRTARQRYVMSLMIDKAKSAGVSKLLDIAQQVFSGEENIIRTSIEYEKMLEMIPVFIDFELGETKGFPFHYTYPDSSLTNGESAVAVSDLHKNVSELHQFLYQDGTYKPSERVTKIHKRLIQLFGE